MKRTLRTKALGRLLAISIAAFGCWLAPIHATTIGVNFLDDWGEGSGEPVTAEAFGVPLANWYNMPRLFNSAGGGGVSGTFSITLPEGGSLSVEWFCQNTWSLYSPDPTPPGNDQVIYGYLDDGGPGYRVRLSGFRNVASDYSITLIASTDGGTGFGDAFVATGAVTNQLQYLDPQIPDFVPSALYAVSTPSSVIPTLLANDTAVITSVPRDGSVRSTLAGILVNYTPGGSNPPLVEIQPNAPPGIVYEGSPFSLEALVSGSPTLDYRWRRGGVPIENATSAIYSKLVSAVADSGDYDLVATNTFGSVTSRSVAVTITPISSPQLTTSPISQSVYPGYPAVFEAEASGGQLRYQWKKGGVVLPEATNSVFALPSVSVNDQGTYAVTVSNARGSVLASAVLTVAPPTGAYETAVAASKPGLYFRMSETSPVVQVSATNLGSLGTAGDGVYVGALSLLTQGALADDSDTAVTLSGGRISVPYNEALNPAGSFTAECWASPANTVAGRRALVQSMINGQFPDNPNDRSGWAFLQEGTDLSFYVGGDNGDPFYTTILKAPGVVTAGVWNHYAAVYNSQTLNISLLVNGVEVASVLAAQAVLPNQAAPLIVGDRGFGGWTFQGSLDEVALYATNLTSSQLLAHYQTGINPATSANYPTLILADGAVEYLRLDESPAPSAAAPNQGTWGAAWTGSYVGGGSTPGEPLIATGASGPIPSTFDGFEPDNTAVSMTNGWVTSPRLVLGDRVTTMCWINREEISTTGDLSWPAWLGGGGLHLNNGSASNPDAELRYHWNGDKWDWSSQLFVPANVWTFAALVIEPEQAVIYMSDGTTLLSSTNTTSHLPMIVNSPPGFGGNQKDRADRNYIGSLDEAAVYDRALSGEEINTIFTSAFAKGPLPPSPLILSIENGQHLLTWTSGVLQSASGLSGTFADVVGANSPYPMVPASGQNFYRLRGAN